MVRERRGGSPPSEAAPGAAPPPQPSGPGPRVLFGSLALLGGVLPLPVLSGLAWGLAPLLRLASPPLRRALLANACRLLGPSSSAGGRRALARAQLRSFARFACEMAALHPRPGGLEELVPAVDGAENLALALDDGGGVVAVTLHAGNYEVAAAVLARRVRDGVAVVYRRDPSRLWEGRRARFRRAAGVGGIAMDASPFFTVEALARLRQGGAVLLAADQPDAGEGERVELLGAPARLSALPARLAVAAKAPLLPALALRGRRGTFTLRLEKPLHPDGRDPAELTRELAEVFQDWLRRWPGSWLQMRSFWEEEPA